MYTKSSNIELKVLDESGTISGIASRYGVLDHDNEVLDPFAFESSLKSNGGKGLPILFQHQRDQIIGWTTGASETRDALHVAGKLNLSGKGKEVHDLIKLGLATGAQPNLSIGFSCAPGGTYFEKGVRHFKKGTCDLKEWSVVTWGACPGAAIMEAKFQKEGRAISAATAAQIQEVIRHIKMATGKHQQALELLEGLCPEAVYPQDDNAPNPAGGGKEYDPLANLAAQKMLREIEAFLRL
jgi:HK97 family phage prohead protease